MKLKLPIPILVAATALALISCGGGGGGSKELSLMSRVVQDNQRLSIMSISKSGIALAPFMMHGFTGGGGGTTGSTGGYGGVSNIGFFFRYFGGSTSGGTTGSGGFAGGTTGGTTGTSGTTGTNGGNGSNFYFDEWLGLWVDVAWSEGSSTTTFTLDEAKTLPAGHVTTTYTGEFGTYPQTYTNEYEFTAGPLAGSHGTYNCTQTSETHGSMEYENTYADGSSDSGESSWTNQITNVHSRWDGANGTWMEDHGSWAPDNSGVYLFTNYNGWSTSWQYNSDWSGSATFAGPEQLLPATMTWTTEGRYTIVYSDGSTESWDWEDFWGDNGEGGTTGSGSSSSSAGTSTTG